MAKKSEDWHDKYLDDAASTLGEACAEGGICGSIVMGIIALVAAICLLFRKKMIYPGKIEDLKVVRNGDYVEYRIPDNDHLLWRYNALQASMFVGKPGCQTQEEFDEGVRLCLQARMPLVRPANILDWGDLTKELL